MKRLGNVMVALLLAASQIYAADIKVSELPAATTVGSTDVFVGVQSGVTKKFSLSLISSGVVADLDLSPYVLLAGDADGQTIKGVTGTGSPRLALGVVDEFSGSLISGEDAGPYSRLSVTSFNEDEIPQFSFKNLINSYIGSFTCNAATCTLLSTSGANSTQFSLNPAEIVASTTELQVIATGTATITAGDSVEISATKDEVVAEFMAKNALTTKSGLRIVASDTGGANGRAQLYVDGNQAFEASALRTTIQHCSDYGPLADFSTIGNPIECDRYYDLTLNLPCFYDGTGWKCAADPVALGTDTTGDYVASATASQGLLLTGTEAGSLGLIDCAASQVLKRNVGDTAWECAADDSGAGGVSDGDKGDITVSGSGSTWNVDADSIALGTDTTGGYAASLTEGGAATTATALAADPADCAANQFATTIAASGALGCSALSDADIPNGITITLASTATALAANGSNCAAGNYPLGVDASGAVESCTTDDDVPEAADYSALTAGRSLTAPSAGTIDADAELYTHTKCMMIESPAVGDDFLFFRAETAITITGIDCLAADGTSVAVLVKECNSNGGACGNTEASITCGTTNTTEASGIDDSAVDAGDWMRIDPGTNTGTVTQLSVCVTFTVND